MIDCITKYFELTPTQIRQFEALGDLYNDWNAKINVISRKDIDNLYEHHVLHSLALAKYIGVGNNYNSPSLHNERGLGGEFSSFLDLGTGGGFPGIPLAIMFPEHKFRLIDSIGKKVKVAKAIGDAIGLKNCEYLHQRAQEDRGHYDIIVSRAVMELGELVKIVKPLAKKNSSTQSLTELLCRDESRVVANRDTQSPSRLICLKGGNIEEEIEKAHFPSGEGTGVRLLPISDYFSEEWFTDKYIVSVNL